MQGGCQYSKAGRQCSQCCLRLTSTSTAPQVGAGAILQVNISKYNISIF
jgi:hypothetical protein